MRRVLFLIAFLAFTGRAAGAGEDIFLLVEPRQGPGTISFSARAGFQDKAGEVKTGALRFAVFYANGKSAGIFGVLRYAEDTQQWESRPVSLDTLPEGEYFAHFTFEDDSGHQAKKRIYFHVVLTKKGSQR